ncbi:unnamed protein product [Prorocentrum cordatum]|uniref:NAD-dependent epimerase/dehydratase domain-containing protein n=1 Tax=Prorocentrum cordatum TaxID=2364126 RepID=A0ABN9TX43_9DINO|nr:unnamed protein product [Polarella glacialis]
MHPIDARTSERGGHAAALAAVPQGRLPGARDWKLWLPGLAALVEVFRANGVRCRGFDLAAAGTTDVVGCASDLAALRSAAAGCRSVVHAAALHAPHLGSTNFYSAEDFELVNISGTRNVISVVKETPMLGMVFSSTTSLMNTAEAKRRAACEVIVQVASEDYGTPRNAYGVTKKAAEQACLREAGMNVAVLRCSRFFVEDAYDTSAAPEDRAANDPDGRVKALELLCGTRASLEDVLIAHVAALSRVCGTWSTSTQPAPVQAVRGPLIVSAISPLVDIAAQGVCTSSVEGARDMYESLGWALPDKRCGRVLDSRKTWEALELTPKWNFERLVKAWRSARDGAAIKSGQY